MIDVEWYHNTIQPHARTCISDIIYPLAVVYIIKCYVECV